MKTKLSSLIALLLAICICLSGCGGDQTDLPSSPESTPSASPSVGSSSDVSTPESTPDEDPPLIDVSDEFTYAFNNTLNGSAAGVITYTTEHTGMLYAYWDSDAAEDAKWGARGELFDKYEPFASGYAIKGNKLVLNIHEWVVIPEGATRILIVHGVTGDTVYVYDLPEEKIFDRGELRYTFGSISDAHIGNRYGSPETSVNSLKNALNLLAGHNVSMVAISGDITVNGSEPEYKTYKSIIDSFCAEHPNVNVYSTTGNHDIPGWKSYWPIYGVGSENYTGELEIQRYEGNDYDYTVSVGDDIFVFLTQREQFYNNTMRRIISKEQMDWLRARFEENKDKTVYLYFHTFLNDENGDASNGYYEYDLPLCEGAPDDRELRALLRENKNVIMFTGHSHWIFSMQDAYDADEGRYNNNANIANGGGEYGVLVHNPSVSEPRGLTGNSSSRDELHGKRSEGYVVYVYDTCVVLYAYDFMNDNLLARYSYIIDTSATATATAEALNDSCWTLSSADLSASLMIDDMSACLFIAKDGKTKTYIGKLTLSEDGSVLYIGENEFRIIFSVSGGSISLTVDGNKYELLKDAATSDLLK